MLLLSAKKQALNFNPRSHERSDSTSSASYSFWINFNPRSHERSDPLSQTILLLYRLFQSTLPREERPYLFAVNALLSNHFNPRSHERSDFSCRDCIMEIIDFNPRSHERSDSDIQCACVHISSISIHAPTRGATFFTFLLRVLIPKFQSTLPREERQSDDTC